VKELRRRAGLEPLGVDISDFSDEWCAGFVAGQQNLVEFLASRADARVRLVVAGRAEALAKLERAGERVKLGAGRVRRAWVGIGITLGEITLAEQEHEAAMAAFDAALAMCLATRKAQ
jgi:predicted negative regulator of RcsB-dependent stress response